MRSAILLAGLLLVAGCAAPPPDPDLGIGNAARVADGIWRGAQPDADGLRRLREAGFRTVMNLRSAHSERTAVESLGLRCVEIPMVAAVDADPPTEAEIDAFLAVLLDPAARPVFFHCARGKDRTGVMCAVYRMEAEGWSPEEALAEMLRFGASPWYRDLHEFVRGYRPRSRR